MYIIVVTDSGGASASHHSSPAMSLTSSSHHHARKQVMVKLSQYPPQIQIKKLIKARMFNTATGFATMLVENRFGQLDKKEYTHL